MTTPSHHDLLELIDEKDEVYFRALREFLGTFDEQYWQPMLAEFSILEFEYIKN